MHCSSYEYNYDIHTETGEIANRDKALDDWVNFSLWICLDRGCRGAH